MAIGEVAVKEPACTDGVTGVGPTPLPHRLHVFIHDYINKFCTVETVIRLENCIGVHTLPKCLLHFLGSVSRSGVCQGYAGGIR